MSENILIDCSPLTRSLFIEAWNAVLSPLFRGLEAAGDIMNVSTSESPEMQIKKTISVWLIAHAVCIPSTSKTNLFSHSETVQNTAEQLEVAETISRICFSILQCERTCYTMAYLQDPRTVRMHVRKLEKLIKALNRIQSLTCERRSSSPREGTFSRNMTRESLDSNTTTSTKERKNFRKLSMSPEIPASMSTSPLDTMRTVRPSVSTTHTRDFAIRKRIVAQTLSSHPDYSIFMDDRRVKVMSGSSSHPILSRAIPSTGLHRDSSSETTGLRRVESSMSVEGCRESMEFSKQMQIIDEKRSTVTSTPSQPTPTLSTLNQSSTFPPSPGTNLTLNTSEAGGRGGARGRRPNNRDSVFAHDMIGELNFLFQQQRKAANKFAEITGLHVYHARQSQPRVILVDFVGLTSHFATLARAARKRRRKFKSSYLPSCRRVLGRLELCLSVASMVFRAQSCLATFQLPVAMFCLSECKRLMDNRQGMIGNDFSTSRSPPFLLTWAERFFKKLVAKASLYFRGALSNTQLHKPQIGKKGIGKADTGIRGRDEGKEGGVEKKKANFSGGEGEMVKRMANLVIEAGAECAFLIFDLETMREKGFAFGNINYTSDMAYRLPLKRASVRVTLDSTSDDADHGIALGLLEEEREQDAFHGMQAWPCICSFTRHQLQSSDSSNKQPDSAQGVGVRIDVEQTNWRRLLWPSIISTIMEHRDTLDGFGPPITVRERVFRSSAKEICHVISQIEPCIFLTVIHTHKQRKEKEILDLILNLSRRVRLVTEVGLLRPQKYRETVQKEAKEIRL
ncbi:hypothetical protein AAMO2058_001056100 [Amorphochlora amoebiformis]